MKAFLILVLVTSSTTLEYEKISIKKFTNCDDAFESKATWFDNPKYKPGNYEVWGFYVYNNKVIAAHYCLDQNGNYLL